MQPTGSPTLCSHCGARLRAGVPGEVLRCQYCGTETRVPLHAQPLRPEPAIVVRRRRSQAAARVIALMAGFFAVVAMLIAFVVVPSLRPRPVAVDLPRMPAVPPEGQKRSPADYFGEVADLHAWTLLDVTPPGPAADFDPLAAAPWAEGIAKQWKPDAQLVRVDVDALDETGRLDLATTHEAKATFRFWSPQAFAEYERSASPSAMVRYEVELLLEVSGEGVKGLRVSIPLPNKEPRLVVPKSCSPKQAVGALRARKKLPDRHAYYSAYLMDVAPDAKRGEPSWYVNPTNHAFSLPPVDARTCTVKW